MNIEVLSHAFEYAVSVNITLTVAEEVVPVVSAQKVRSPRPVVKPPVTSSADQATGVPSARTRICIK